MIVDWFPGTAGWSRREACRRKAAEGRLPRPGEGRPQEEGRHPRQDQRSCTSSLNKINAYFRAEQDQRSCLSS